MATHNYENDETLVILKMTMNGNDLLWLGATIIDSSNNVVSVNADIERFEEVAITESRNSIPVEESETMGGSDELLKKTLEYFSVHKKTHKYLSEILK